MALPDPALPGGAKLETASFPSLNDSGVIAFLARRQGDSRSSAYLWQQGAITPLAEIGTDSPGGGRFNTVGSALVNNRNQNVLLAARVRTGASVGVLALYRFSGGKVTPRVAPGQPMPGGGLFNGIRSGGGTLNFGFGEISAANAQGQHAFLALVDDRDTAGKEAPNTPTPRAILDEPARTVLFCPPERRRRDDETMRRPVGAGTGGRPRPAPFPLVVSSSHRLVVSVREAKYRGYVFEPYNGPPNPRDPRLGPPLVSDRDLVAGSSLSPGQLKPVFARHFAQGDDSGLATLIFADGHVKAYSTRAILAQDAGASPLIWRFR